MIKSTISQATVDGLVERFAEIAIAQDQALLHDEVAKYNRLYTEMDLVDEELRARGTKARLSLTRLFDHPNLQVRMKAAVHSLAIDVNARKVLEAIARSGELPQSLHSGMTLWNLDRGVFKPT